MDVFAVPGDVVDALAAAGYRVVEAVGASAWLAVPVDALPVDALPGDLAARGGAFDGPVEVHALPVEADALLTRRAELLAGLRHPHLARVHALLALSPARAGLVVEHVPGVSLDRLRAARAPLGDGEAATVAIPVAEALGALHAVGLAHGGVRAESVVVRPDGRPVLGDLRGALLGGGAADDDVRRLLATVLGVMPGPDVELLAGVGGQPSLRAAFEVLLAEPGLTADAVVDRCFEVVEPEPIRLPDAGSFAAASLAGAGRRADVPGRRAVTDGGHQRRARGRAGRRAWRSPRVVLTVAAVLLVAAALAGAAAVTRSTGAAGRAGGPIATTSARSPSSSDPRAAAEELTRQRARVLAAVDRGGLTTVDAEGGPAFAADARLLDGLGARSLEGLSVEVSARTRGAATSSRAEVVVTSTTSGYVRVGEDGTRTPVPAGPTRSVLLELRHGDDGWRVWDVRAP